MRLVTTSDTLRTTDGLQLAVQRHTTAESLSPTGPGEDRHPRPTLVAVHGYPDNARVWNALIPYLVEEVDVVTFDVRGTGASEAPATREGYLLTQLTADVDAVVAWAGERANGSVHLLAHDWGSIQAWQAVTGRGATSTVASYTSISGPCLEHVGSWFGRHLRPGSPGFREALRQLAHSSYIAFFKVRGLAELAGSTGLLARFMSSATDAAAQVPDFTRHRRDITNGLELYRQNMLTRRARSAANVAESTASTSEPRGPRTTQVPVQVITPTQDPYVGPALGACAREVMPDVRVTPLEAGHWAIVTHAPAVAATTLAFMAQA